MAEFRAVRWSAAPPHSRDAQRTPPGHTREPPRRKPRPGLAGPKDGWINGFFEGINKNEIFDHQEYTTVKNHSGDDSLIYLRQNQDSILIYSLNYLEYDKVGNWITRQFIKNKQFQGQLISYTLYRKIEYYD